MPSVNYNLRTLKCKIIIAKKDAVSRLKFLRIDHCDREEKERGGGRSFSDPLQVRIIFCGAFIFKFSKFQTREIFFQMQGLEISLLHFLLYMCQTTFVIRKERN